MEYPGASWNRAIHGRMLARQAANSRLPMRRARTLGDTPLGCQDTCHESHSTSCGRSCSQEEAGAWGWLFPIMHSFYRWPFTHTTHLGTISLIPVLADGAGKSHLRTIKRGKTACRKEKHFFLKAADWTHFQTPVITSRPMLQYVFLYLKKVLWDRVFLCNQVGFRVTRKPRVTSNSWASHVGILSVEVINTSPCLGVFSLKKKKDSVLYNCVEKKPHSSSGAVLNLCKWAGSRLVSAITDLALQNEGREHLSVQHWIPTQSVPPSTFRKPRFHLIFLASHRCEPCFLQMESKFSSVRGSGRWQRPCVAGGLSEPHLRIRELSWAGMGLGMWGQEWNWKTP